MTPEGSPAISQGLSAARPPDGMVCATSDPRGVATIHAQSEFIAAARSELLAPLRGAVSYSTPTGGVAALNPANGSHPYPGLFTVPAGGTTPRRSGTRQSSDHRCKRPTEFWRIRLHEHE